MVTLGLDASTTCVGYAFTEDKKILDMGFIDIKKEKTPKEKVQKVLEFLNNSSYIDKVIDINVEDSLSGFAGGFTSQQTIIKLAKFNAILGFVLEDEFITEKGVSLCYEGAKKSHGRVVPTLNKALYSFYHWVEKGGKYDELKYDESEKIEKIYSQTLDKLYI